MKWWFTSLFTLNNSIKNMSHYRVNLMSQTCQAYSKLKATSMVASTFMGMASNKFSILMFTYKILKTAPHFIQASFGWVVVLLLLIMESFGEWASLFYQLRNIGPTCQYMVIPWLLPSYKKSIHTTKKRSSGRVLKKRLYAKKSGYSL